MTIPVRADQPFNGPIDSSAPPVPDADSKALDSTVLKADDKLVMTIPGPKDQIAAEISEVGAEGRPADAKAGPGTIKRQMLGWGVAMILLAVVAGVWISPPAGFAMLALGAMTLLFNPVMGAARSRMHERQVVSDRHTQER